MHTGEMQIFDILNASVKVLKSIIFFQMVLFVITGFLSGLFLVSASSESNQTIESLTNMPVLSYGKSLVELW
jgi:hypothetical protein